jgi:hypothetical protein
MDQHDAHQPVDHVPPRAADGELFSWASDGPQRKFHRTPDGFIFPHGSSITIKSVWDLWFFGGQQEIDGVMKVIGPYKFFNSHIDLKSETDRTYLSKVRYAVDKIVSHGVRCCGLTSVQIGQADRATSSALFETCYNSLCDTIYATTRDDENWLSNPIRMKVANSFVTEYGKLYKFHNRYDQ